MPALQVRDFPDELYDELKAYAVKNHRSIAQQTIACIENELMRSKVIEGDLSIPQNVLQGSARAKAVDAFAWLDEMRNSSDEDRALRIEKRIHLAERIRKLNDQWEGLKPTLQDTVKMVREDRDSDHRLGESFPATKPSTTVEA